MQRSDFGPGFRFGVATSAYQIEGSTTADGRGESIWDRFARPRRRLGRLRSPVKERATADVACDHYRRWEADLDLLVELGVDAYRFSIAWPRLVPLGEGAVNPAGVAFYHRLIDGLLERGIEPFVTLYHWDLPQALEDRGGWCARATVDAFRGYAELCAREYGTKVRHWIVLNEALAFTLFGYMLGAHAPGRRFRGNFLPAVHHALLAQAEGARALKAANPSAEVGTAAALPWYLPLRDDDADRAAVRRFESLARAFVDPHLGRGYPVDVLPCFERIERWCEPGDLERLVFPLDFLGINHYWTWVVRARPLVPRLRAWSVKGVLPERTDLGWNVHPAGFGALLRRLGADPAVPKLYVTENGAAYADALEQDGVHDEPRRSFLERHLAELAAARADGVAVAGYFAWSLMDNFEWTEGYGPRFGLVHVDYATQRRTLKDSGRWYRDLLRS